MNATRTAPGRLERFLDSKPSCDAGSFRALGFTFSVRVMGDDLASHLGRVLHCLRCDDQVDHRYGLVDRGPEASLRRYVLWFDGTVLGRFTSASVAVGYLLWHVNSRVVAESRDYLLFHAAAVEYCGTGILLPAPMDSGKTTLAAGLVQTGFRYVTDECAALQPETLELYPYPKSLAIDSGSWGVLADLQPHVGVLGYSAPQWHVPPTSIRDDALAPVCRPRLIVSPRYEPGARTQLVPLRDAEAVLVLAENSFDLAWRLSDGLNLIARLVRQCRCYRLDIGSLDEACDAVLSLVNSGERVS